MPNPSPTVSFTLKEARPNLLRIGLAGLGTVGRGVYKTLLKHPLTDSGFLKINTVAARNKQKAEATLHNIHGLFAPQPASSIQSPDTLPMVTTETLKMASDPNLDLIIEVMGGVDVAKTLVETALNNGKHVVTANKELIAKHGPALFRLAEERGACLLFEGAVAGGIPIILPLQLSLAGNQVIEIAGILNGTTNYILSQMSDSGWDYQQALQAAQAKGFAEADPTNDVEGYDTAYKIAILASIAFKKQVPLDAIYCKGMTQISALDIQNARELGFVIKLLGRCRWQEADDALDVRVHPVLVPLDHPLASIQQEYNAVWVQGDAVGDVMFSGRGAGELPTASAVCGDVLLIANSLQESSEPASQDRPLLKAMRFQNHEAAKMLAITETINRYYIRLNTLDEPGVIGNLGHACGMAEVSLETVLQKKIEADGTASIVLITHDVTEQQMRQALDTIIGQSTTQSIGAVLRVF